jgi:hypothetical protein
MSPLIATIVTGKQAWNDFQVFLHTVDMWHPTARVYVYTDSQTLPNIKSCKSKCTVIPLVEMNKYQGLTRSDMEAMNSETYDSLFKEFTVQKIFAMAHIFDTESTATKEGVWFLDADICLLAPLPTVPDSATLGLSPHYIRPGDEARYGRFNAGFLWVKEPSYLSVWNTATRSSRFFEQAALEEVAKSVSESQRHVFPIQDNFGWWRHGQSVDPPPTIQKRFGFHRSPSCIGLKYDGNVLRSIHTHWNESSVFNGFVFDLLKKVMASHAPAKSLVLKIRAIHAPHS